MGGIREHINLDIMDANNRKLLVFLNSYNIRESIQEPIRATKHSAAIINNIITNTKESEIVTKVINEIIYDHYAQIIENRSLENVYDTATRELRVMSEHSMDK